jgi:periplasmic copper chaperone A
MKTPRAIFLITLLCAAFSADAQVTATNAWIRGVVKGQTATGAFMTLKTGEATRLVAASSPVAKVVQIHEMKMNGDMMTMRPVEGIALAAHTAIELRPGGYHVMLMGLTKPLPIGDKVPIRLSFVGQDGARRTLVVQAEVRGLAQPDPPAKMEPMK